MASWTDEKVGRFGFGCMRLPMVDGKVDLEATSAMFDAFLASGLNYFDTAHGYLDGQSEVAVRECLVKRHPRDAFFLTDKLTANFFKTADDVMPVLEDELVACGVDHFDLLLMHAQGLSNYDHFMECRAYEQAREFVAQGKAHHMGISFHDRPEVLARILDEHPEVEAVQIQLNYEDWEAPAIQSRRCYEVCAERGLPVIVMEPVKGGNLVNLPDDAQAALDEVPNPEHLSNAGFALRFAATQPGVAMILSGMGDMAQLRDNLSTMVDPSPLDDEQVAGLRHVHEVLAAKGLIPCTACHYCTAGCPKHINIPEVFGCLNDKRAFGGWNSAYYYGQVHTTGGHAKASECLGCGRCEQVCPQHLPIRKLLEEVAAEFE
ncbi:MAG: aldo/keto reductase [Atopobiaceae bacterium]|nr:aldo/keto reductase [Atopobiaceae bacterium]MCH4179911.1 aldo/keto reductase [Atopobiaceae bacterium]MCH4213662.1 aldo/keto reductase [Atopobiaceae bacterium]MCH4275981.1 aldo/keto reductase [Atopobiaceae bacterium]MCI1225738.1 aldo/keto reductase [Atopobiaceae bacterium]